MRRMKLRVRMAPMCSSLTKVSPSTARETKYRADLVHAVAVWACEPVTPDADIRTQQRADILGHRFRDLIAHRALFLDERRVNAQQLRLGLVRVGHNAALEKRARSGHTVKRFASSPPVQLSAAENVMFFSRSSFITLSSMHSTSTP